MEEKIQRLKDLPIYMYVTATGGGHTISSEILKSHGGSKIFAGAEVPYSTDLSIDILGREPKDKKYCSEWVSRHLAHYSHNKLHICLDAAGKEKIGVGISAVLGYDGQREGRQNKAHLSIFDGESYFHRKLQFNNAKREEQERIIVNEVVDFILLYSENLKKDGEWCLSSKWDNYPATYSEKQLKKGMGNNLLKAPNCIIPYDWDDIITSFVGGDLILYPGSFDPIHQGHLEIIDTAKSIFNTTPITVITVKNRNENKSFDWIDVVDRYRRIKSKGIPFSLVTGGALFYDIEFAFRRINKNFNNSNIIFLAGYDTYCRFYNDYNPLGICDQDCNFKFLVFPRNGEGVATMDDYKNINKKFVHPESYNLKNPQSISSTQIRKAQY